MNSYIDEISDYYEMDPYYAEQLKNFDDEIDMCNQLGLNLDEIYNRVKDPYSDD